MKDTTGRAKKVAPEVTEEQLAELRGRLAVAPREPILPAGSVSECPNCGGRMLTTNDLEEMVPTPGLVYVVARLPGARCLDCKSTELDAAGVAILESTTPRGILADYETTVSHSSGTTLGTYFKMDLARVMGLSGDERLLWKVVDRDKAFVQIARKERRTHAGSRAQPSRGRPRTRALAAKVGPTKKGQDNE